MAEEDTKKGLALIIAKKMGEEKGEDSDSDGSKYEDLAKEIIGAVHDKNAQAAASALKAFVKVCYNDNKGAE